MGVLSYAVAIACTLLIRFPSTMAGPADLAAAEIAAGFRYSWRHPRFRWLLIFFVVFDVFSAPLLLAIPPLVLATGSVADLGWVLLASASAGVLGGLAMAVWGGPPRRRMRSVLLCTLLLAGFVLLTGVRADPLTIGIGVFGTSLWLTMLRGLHAAIVEIKVPERFRPGVLAMDTVRGWAAIPIGVALIAACAAAFEPLQAPGAGLASTVGAVIGMGPGRGIALAYLLVAAAIALLAAVASTSGLARLMDDSPDATPDDVIGLQALGRHPSTPSEGA